MAAYEGFWKQVRLSNTVNVLAAIKGKQRVERSLRTAEMVDDL